MTSLLHILVYVREIPSSTLGSKKRNLKIKASKAIAYQYIMGGSNCESNHSKMSQR